MKTKIHYRTEDDALAKLLQGLNGDEFDIAPLDGTTEGAFAHIWILDAERPAALPAVEAKPFVSLILAERERGSHGTAPDTIMMRKEPFLKSPDSVLRTIVAMLPILREKQILMREIAVLKTVETLYLTQEQDKAFSQLIYAVADLLETSPTGMILLRDPKKSAYDEFFPLEERRKGRRHRHTFHPEFLDEILYSSEPYTIVEDPNEPREKLVGLPIRNNQEGMGIIFLPIDDSVHTHERLLVAARFTTELSSVMENLLLFMETKELTIKDDLTQAYNRRYFEAFVDEELERAKRYGSKFSLIFLDLDDLKKVNDCYGHLMGSRTLQEVSKRILGAVRHVDRVVRFGGDEFCVILPHTDPEEAVRVAERVRTAINDSSFTPAAGVDIQITASFGVAGYPIHGKTKETLIARADQAMYDIKTRQKNGVQMARKVDES